MSMYITCTTTEASFYTFLLASLCTIIFYVVDSVRKRDNSIQMNNSSLIMSLYLMSCFIIAAFSRYFMGPSVDHYGILSLGILVVICFCIHLVKVRIFILELQKRKLKSIDNYLAEYVPLGPESTISDLVTITLKSPLTLASKFSSRITSPPKHSGPAVQGGIRIGC